MLSVLYTMNSQATLYSEFWTAHNYIQIQLEGREHLSVCN